MSDYHVFEGRITPIEWGKATYTILPLPAPVAQALLEAGARRVRGEIAEHPVNLALSRAPVVDGVFLWAGRSLLDRIGIAPGEAVEVRLRPAPDEDVVEPPDLVAALAAQGLMAAWHTLTPGRRRSLLYPLDSARRPETRARRLAALLARLADGR
jgi:hypothetical protein